MDSTYGRNGLMSIVDGQTDWYISATNYIALINANGLPDGSTNLNDDAKGSLVTNLTCYGTCDVSTAVTKNSSVG